MTKLSLKDSSSSCREDRLENERAVVGRWCSDEAYLSEIMLENGNDLVQKCQDRYGIGVGACKGQ